MKRAIGNSVILTALGAALVLGLSACEGTKDALGLTKKAPDEFAVYRRAPLSLPPDYGLRPPEPGAPRPQAVTPASRARGALLGEKAEDGGAGPDGKRSLGEVALLKSANALDVDPGIRATVNRETSIYSHETVSFTEKLMFWDHPAPYGSVIDANKEAKRIRDNQALGKPLTEGEVPTIKRKPKALLEGLFD
jgi:hypothetical protein